MMGFYHLTLNKKRQDKYPPCSNNIPTLQLIDCRRKGDIYVLQTFPQTDKHWGELSLLLGIAGHGGAGYLMADDGNVGV